MPDEPKQREDDREVSRRRFFQVTGAAACTVAAGGAAVLSADFLRPRVLFEPPSRFTIGPPEAIDLEQVLTNELFRAYVVRRAEGFHAMSSICTHLGCVTRYRSDEGLIACPCHGSRFNLDGDVLAGPAPRPLHWLAMDLSARGEIEVDTASEVPEGTLFKL